MLTASTGMFRLWKSEFVHRKHLSGNTSSIVLSTERQTKQPQAGERAGQAWLFSVDVCQTPLFGGSFERSLLSKSTQDFISCHCGHNNQPPRFRENFPADLMVPAARISSLGNFNEVQHRRAQRGFRLDLAFQLAGLGLNQFFDNRFGNFCFFYPENEGM